MYQFTYDWFSKNIPSWDAIFASQNWGDNSPLTIVEIGSFEGNSACWLCETKLGHPDSRLYCIDTFQGSEEHSSKETDALEQRFRHNIAQTGKAEKVEVLVGYSQHMLIKLIQREIQADIVYVDGSHTAQDVLTDAVLSWQLLKSGGIMIFDDYLWVLDQSKMHANPKLGIDSFVNAFFPDITLFSGLHNDQFYLRKR